MFLSVNNRDHQRLKDHVKGASEKNCTQAIGFIGEVADTARCTQCMTHLLCHRKPLQINMVSLHHHSKSPTL